MNRYNRIARIVPELPPGMDPLASVVDNIGFDGNVSGHFNRVATIKDVQGNAGINGLNDTTKPERIMHDAIPPSLHRSDFLFYDCLGNPVHPLNSVVQAVNDLAVPIFKFRSGKLLNNGRPAFLSDQSGHVHPTPISLILPLLAGTIDQPKRETKDQNNPDQDSVYLVSGHTNTGLSAKGNTISASVCRACNRIGLRSAGLSAHRLYVNEAIKV